MASINLRQKLACALMCALMMVPTAAQTVMTHPWQGKRVAYFGDSITDPRNKASKKKYWGFLEDWLGITPYVYAVSGRQWNDIPRQAGQLHTEHGDSVDAILIFIGTNDYNAGVPIGEWFTETDEKVMAGIHEPKHLVSRKQQHLCMDNGTYRGRINIALSTVKKMYPTKQIVLLTPHTPRRLLCQRQELATHRRLPQPVRRISCELCRRGEGGRQHLGGAGD